MHNHPTDTKGMAIMLYVTTPEIGDNFYHTYLEPLNFPRNRYPNAPFYTDYHLTLGYIENVHSNDTSKLTSHLTSALSNNINLDQLFFKFGIPTLLGHPRKSFFAILPENTDEFRRYNQILFESLKYFKNGLYSLDHHTLPDNYLPHINLYGQVNKDIRAEFVASTLKYLSNKLHGKTLSLSKIRIR